MSKIFKSRRDCADPDTGHWEKLNTKENSYSKISVQHGFRECFWLRIRHWKALGCLTRRSQYSFTSSFFRKILFYFFSPKFFPFFIKIYIWNTMSYLRCKSSILTTIMLIFILVIIMIIIIFSIIIDLISWYVLSFIFLFIFFIIKRYRARVLGRSHSFENLNTTSKIGNFCFGFQRWLCKIGELLDIFISKRNCLWGTQKLEEKLQFYKKHGKQWFASEFVVL